MLASAESKLAAGPDFLGPVDPECFYRSFGIGPQAVSLIRPDGYIAWRSIDMRANAAGALTDALARLSFATWCA